MPAHHTYPDPPPPSPSRESASMRALTLSGGRGILSFDASSRRRPPPTTSHQASPRIGRLSRLFPRVEVPVAGIRGPLGTRIPTRKREVTLSPRSARTRARRASARTARTRAVRAVRDATVRLVLSIRSFDSPFFSMGTTATQRPSRSLIAVVSPLGPGFDSRGDARPDGGSRTRRLAGRRQRTRRLGDDNCSSSPRTAPHGGPRFDPGPR